MNAIKNHLQNNNVESQPPTETSMNITKILKSADRNTIPPLVNQTCCNEIWINDQEFNPFVPSAPFLYPLKTLENRKVFWCFQGVEKKCIGNEWVNRLLSQRQHFPKHHTEYKTIIKTVQKWIKHLTFLRRQRLSEKALPKKVNTFAYLSSSTVAVNVDVPPVNEDLATCMCNELIAKRRTLKKTQTQKRTTTQK